MGYKIDTISSKEILSAGAYPTIETSILLENGSHGKASVPFGSSAGDHEAAVIQDNDKERYQGKGMLQAIKNVEEVIAPALAGMDISNQQGIDEKLNELDSTAQKTELGGNSILSVSLAAARTAAKANSVPLYEYLKNSYQIGEEISSLPKPMMVMIEGGAHADNSTDFQEYLITVDLQANMQDRVRAGIEIYHSLANILQKAGYNTNVGLEGAYAPSGIESNTAPLKFLVEAIKASGYSPDDEVGLAMDTAASEFYSNGIYKLSVENKELSAEDLLEYYIKMVQEYPVVSIEDPYDEDDWEAWKSFYQQFNEQMMVVGDDLTVSQLDRVKKAAESKTINALIIKPNQAGTLTEIMDTVNFAREQNYKLIVSHRGGGETTDTFIADLATAIGAEYIKTGPSRGERVVKYNRLMEIGEKLGL